MRIDWDYPKPRQGIKGALDKFIGPGATRGEIWLQLVPAVAAAVTAPLYALARGLHWSTTQLVVAGVLGFDMVGGVITNSTSSAKRWYHRSDQTFKDHFGFVALHIFHLFIVAWLFRDMNWTYFGVTSAYLLAAAFVILKCPLHVRRPLGYLLYIIAILIGLYAFRPVMGLEWFLPFFYMKLLVSHVLREEPYRPEKDVIS